MPKKETQEADFIEEEVTYGDTIQRNERTIPVIENSSEGKDSNADSDAQLSSTLFSCLLTR
jgi:hypothetical protein